MKKPHFIERLEKNARSARYSLLANLLASVDRPLVVLDLGGTIDYWNRFDYSALGDVEFILFNIHPQKVSPPFVAAVGDGRDLSRYPDREFDVVFSNSVIAFVGAFADQERMAKEIRRVGKRYFVQTPNYWFPIDWRTLVPFFHFLPAPWQAWCFRHFPVGAYPRIKDHAASLNQALRVRDLRRRELAALFPDATIVPEHILGLTKSFMLHKGFDSATFGDRS